MGLILIPEITRLVSIWGFAEPGFVKPALHPQKTAVPSVHKRLSERPFPMLTFLSSYPRALVLHSHDWRKTETCYCS